MESVILTSPGGNQIDYEYQLHKVSGTKGTLRILGELNGMVECRTRNQMALCFIFTPARLCP